MKNKMKNKMKKVLSMGLTIALAAMNAVAIQAEEAVNYADWVPGEITANLIPDATAGGGYKYFGTKYGSVSYSDWYTNDTEIGGYKFKYSYTGTDAPLENANSWAAFAGFYLNRNHGSEEQGNLEGNFGFVAEEGKSYVLKMNLQNASSDGVTPYFGMAFNNRWDDSDFVGSVEHGLTGMKLESGWQEYKATFDLPEGYVSGKYNNDYLDTPIIGFAEGAPVGSAVWIDVSEKDAVYFAEEQIYDIKNTVDKTTVYRGETMTAKAELVNQLGIPGSLNQEFKWTVVNADRSEVVEVPMSVSEDTTEAYITPDSSVETGTYVLMAYSAENGGMYKGAEFTVGEGTYYADFKIPEKTANLIPDSTEQNGYIYFGARQSLMSYQVDGVSTYGTTTEGVASAFKYTYVGNSYVTSGALNLTFQSGESTTSYEKWKGFAGFSINQATGSGGDFGFVAENGKTYVLSANVKSGSPDGVADPYFGSAMNNTWGTSAIVHTNEYGSEGMLLTDEWQKYNVTMTLPEDYVEKTGNAPYQDRVFVGLAEGSEFGSAFWMDASEKDSVYFAEEQIYEFKNTLDKETVLHGEKITANAEILNQLGIPGSLTQDVEWFVVNEDRKTINENFIIDANGTEATVKPMYNVPAGKYVLIAHSETYDINMGAAFTVEEGGYYEDYAPTVKNENLIPDATQSTWFTNTNYASIQFSDWDTADEELGGNTVKFSYTGTEDEAFAASGDAWRIFPGFEMNSYQLGDKMWFDPQPGKSYVFSMNLKNASSDGVVPSFGAAMNGTFGAGGAIMLSDYDSTGMELSSSWKKLEGTFTMPENYAPHNWGKSIYLGFAIGTKPGAAVLIDMSHKDATYVAEEQAYNITLETANETTSSIDLSASITNQLGLPGGLSQEFDWVAVKEDRKTVVDAVKFTENGSSANVTASWDEGLESGTYIIAAVSEDSGLVKTTSISVVRDLQDKMNTAPDNLIPDSTEQNGYLYFGARQSLMSYQVDGVSTYGTKTEGVASAFKFTYVGNSYVTSGALNLTFQDGESKTAYQKWKGFAGFSINQATGSGGDFGFVAENGKTYVLSANVKSGSPDGVADPYFGSAMNNTYGTSAIVHTNEYGSEGMLLTDEWQKYNVTMTLPEDYVEKTVNSPYQNKVYVGLAEGSEFGSAFWMDASEKDSVYFAEEKPLKVSLTTDKVDELTAGAVIDVKAEVVNQIGIPGTLSQDLKWYVVNADRTATVSGVTVEAYDGGAKVTINDANVSDIRIVAVSSEYDLITGINPVKTISDEIKTLYVSTTGDDNADGETAPLATLEGARDRIREIKNDGFDGSYEVIFAGGTYYFDSTVNFEAADSGNKETPITYKAASGEKVVFTGAIELDLSKASKVTNETILARIKDDVEDNIVAIDLTEQGYASIAGESVSATIQTLIGGYEYPELYLNGNEQTLAQWPNGKNKYSTWTYVDADTFGYSDSEPANWASATGWWIGGYTDYDYVYSRIPASSIDTANKQITVAVNDDVKFRNEKEDITRRWKAFNLLEELDAPTEWYIDKDTNILYYYMPEVNDNSTLEISSLKSAMVNLNEADNIAFEGIQFENTRANAISATNVEGITVTGCTFENIGVDAVAVYGTVNATTDKDFWQVQKIDASYNFEVSNNKFNNIGGHAIYMNGGNVDTLTPSGNVIKNNIIYKVAQKIKDYNAIELWGCGITVEHNNISKTSDQAIRHYGNDHLIQYNEIHDVVQDTDDAGAIYGGRNTIQRGTEISYNYIHDILGTFTPAFGHKPAIYWDDYQTGMTAHHNIIKNALINVYTNGIDNNYSYNTSIGITGTNIDFKDGGASPNTEPSSGTTFVSNIADEELYYSEYPTLSTILGTYGSDLKNRKLSALNTIKGNLSVESVSGNGIGEHTNYPNATVLGSIVISNGTKNANVADNTDNGTATFVNAAAQDYRISGTADLSTSVLNENFDIELIGVQTSNTIETSEVELAAPYNKQEVNADTVKFVWYDSFGATNYTITVATDVNMTNVVATEDVNYNYAEIALPANGTTYYWKVTAHNTSREFASDWESVVYTFTNGEKISAEAALSGSAVTVSITNNYYEEGKAANVYVSEYDTNGKLLAAQIWNVTLAYETANIVAENITLKNSDAASVKLFIWDTNNSPLKDTVTLK